MMLQLIAELAKFIEEDLKDIRLPVRQELDNPELPTHRPVKVYQLIMPIPEDPEPEIPYILLQLLSGADETPRDTGRSKSEVIVRILVTTYDKDPVQGRLAVLNIVNKLRYDLQRAGVIGGRFELKKPFEYQIIPDDTLPYHLAEIATVWSIPTVEREIPGFNW